MVEPADLIATSSGDNDTNVHQDNDEDDDDDDAPFAEMALQIVNNDESTSLENLVDTVIFNANLDLIFNADTAYDDAAAAAADDDDDDLDIMSVDSTEPSVSEQFQDDHNEDPDNNSSEEDQLDQVVAAALQNMSLQDREKVYYDQHGVSDIFKETPELVEKCLQEVKQHLDRMMKKKRSSASTNGFRIAHGQDSTFVLHRKLHLKMLRTELFDTKKAVIRLFKYFDHKLFCFGESKLCQAITYKDLNEEDKKAFSRGIIQLLPARDRAGRAVLVFFPSHLEDFAPETIARLFFYSSETRDDSIAKYGIVMVVYRLGEFHFKSFDRKMMQTLSKGLWALPHRLVGFHHCLSDRRYRFVIGIGLRMSSWEIRAKCKLHVGTLRECAFSLMSYGIPTELLPVGPDGEIKRKNHLERITYRKILEDYHCPNNPGGGITSNDDYVEWIEIPSNTDVLVGKGRPNQQHLGNMRLHMLVDDNLGRYYNIGNGASIGKQQRQDKKGVVEDVLQAVRAHSGRFLTQESGVWIEAGESISREKVALMFRNRKKAREKSNRETGADSKSTAPVRPKPGDPKSGDGGMRSDSHQSQKKAKVSS